MKIRNGIRGMLYFLAGVALTLVVMLGFFKGYDAQAYTAGLCPRHDLAMVSNAGGDPDPKYVVYYQVPTCVMSLGYTVEKVYLQSGNVAVEYKKQ